MCSSCSYKPTLSEFLFIILHNYPGYDPQVHSISSFPLPPPPPTPAPAPRLSFFRPLRDTGRREQGDENLFGHSPSMLLPRKCPWKLCLYVFMRVWPVHRPGLEYHKAPHTPKQANGLGIRLNKSPILHCVYALVTTFEIASCMELHYILSWNEILIVNKLIFAVKKLRLHKNKLCG